MRAVEECEDHAATDEYHDGIDGRSGRDFSLCFCRRSGVERRGVWRLLFVSDNRNTIRSEAENGERLIEHFYILMLVALSIERRF